MQCEMGNLHDPPPLWQSLATLALNIDNSASSDTIASGQTLADNWPCVSGK